MSGSVPSSAVSTPARREHGSTHFDVWYVPGAIAARDVATLARRLDALFDDLAQSLGFEGIEARLSVFLGDPSAGQHADDDRMHLHLAYGPDTSHQELERAVLVLLVDEWLGPRAAATPAIVDGLLGHVATKRDARALDQLHDRLIAARNAAPGNLPPVIEALGTHGRSAPLYTEVVAAFTTFLLDTYGAARFRQFARTFEPETPNASVERTYGKDLRQLEREWQLAMDTARAPEFGLVRVIVCALGYWRPHWRMAIWLFALLIVQQLFNTYFALSLKLIIDHAIVGRDATALVRIIGGLVGGFVLASSAGLYGNYLSAKVGAAIINDLRLRMFMHLQQLSMGFYARSQTGDLVSRFSSDLSDIDKQLTTRLLDGLLSLVGILINVPLLFLLDWRLALITLAALPMVMIGTRLFSPKASKASYGTKKQEASIASAVQENVRAQAVVKVFGLDSHAVGSFRDRLRDHGLAYVRSKYASSLIGAASTLGVLLVQIIVLCVGAWLALHGSLGAGSLVAFMSLLVRVGDQTYDLTKKSIPGLLDASGGVRRIEEFLGERPQIVDSEGAPALARVSRDIAFDDVTFSYGQQRSLDGASLRIPAGANVAFVGPSGSGKSTAINLVLRFYDADLGAVRVDGHDLKNVSAASWHRQLGAVFQDTFLFNTTIAENIRMGSLEATREKIEAAARAAEIHDLITAMDKGYDTSVGEGGGQLSGGQRQRIAIARAILRDPAVLVLDEATSALDPGTESAINATIARLAKSRTVVSVTHRLSSVRNADRIFVLDLGRVAEEGNHDELLARKGIYHQLWEKQTGFEVDADGRGAKVKGERLRAVPLFAQLDDGALDQLAARFVPEHVDAGRTVFEEGQVGDKFYVLVRGTVEVVTTSFAAQERRLNVLADGDFFGEIALVEQKPRTATVRALTPCSLLTLQVRQFFDLLDQSPTIRAAIESVVKIRDANLVGESIRQS